MLQCAHTRTKSPRTEGLHRGVTVLRNGGMLGVLIDQHAGDKGVWTPFFGRLASTTPFPAVLAKKTGAALMPVSIVTSGIARWRVEVSVFAVARKIRSRFDVAILFPSFLRPGIEIWLAGIPRRVGFYPQPIVS